MLSRHEEKYILTYAQYVLLRQRALQVLTPDPHGDGGTYRIHSLYYDDPQDTGLAEKQDGLALHSKFRVRTYDHSDRIIKLERKDKKGILTHKQSAAVTRQQLELLKNIGTGDLPEGPARELQMQMQSKLCRPVVGVGYIRDAFYYPGTDLRLTFDRQLQAFPPDSRVPFDPEFQGLPVLEPGSVVMEIKYGARLPSFIRKLTRVHAPQLSLSKYALCRERLR